MLEKVLIGYRLERYLALIRACLLNGAEDDPLASIESMFDLPDIAAASGDNSFHNRRILEHSNCLHPLHLFGNDTYGVEERIVVVHVILHDEKLHQLFQPGVLSRVIDRERPFYWRAF